MKLLKAIIKSLATPWEVKYLSNSVDHHDFELRRKEIERVRNYRTYNALHRGYL